MQESSKKLLNQEKEEEVTIVTAFFDIGRKDFSTYPRANDEYLEYFKVWGKMKNKIVVYTNSAMGEEVRKYRKQYGLLERTTIIEIENEFLIDSELLESMKQVSNDKYFLDYRFITNALSNNYKYDYVMLLKYWCLSDAVKNKYADGMVAWMDFGFNHGSECYIKPEEFNFLWKTRLNNKIHIFTLEEITKKPIFHLVRTLSDNIMGCLIILPSKYCLELWKLIKEAMISLCDIGFIDDDQLLLLMAYRKRKEIFQVHQSTWFMPLKENGADHLTIKDITPKGNLNNAKSRLAKWKKKIIYLKRTLKDLEC